METPKIGILAGLQGLFGWYSSSPVNLTKDEVKGRAGVGSQIAGSGNEDQGLARQNSNASPESRYGDMLAMSDSELVGPMLEVYAEETCQPDINKGRALWYECDDGEIEKDLNAMLDRINSEEHLPSIVMGAAGTGNEFRRILYNDNGVQQLVGIPRADSANSARMPVRRLWDKTTRRLIGFLWDGQKPRDEDVLYPSHKEIFPPWSFIHFRRLYRSDTEYGVAIMDKLYSLWRKIDQSIDQMVLYRRHTMPTRHAVIIDTKEQDITDSMESIHLFAHMLRNQHVMLSAGNMESRYNPPALESMLFLPKRGNDDTTEITSMVGDKDVPDVPDIEQLLKQLYGGARIPKTYMGQDDEGSSLASSSLVSQDIRFARMVRNIRRILVAGFYRLGQIHLALSGKDPTRYNIKVKMSRISTIEEEVNVAILEKQANLANTIATLCQQLEIPNREIIDLVFREYLSVPRYFIDIAKLGTSVARALGTDQDSAGGAGGGGLGGMGGMDDLGDMGDEAGDGMDDLEMPDGSGSEAEPVDGAPPKAPLMSGARAKSGNLFESRRRSTPKQQSVVDSLIRGLSTRMKSLESEDKKLLRAKFVRSIINEVKSISELHTSKRTSLIESYTGEPLITETLPKALVRTAGSDKLVESRTKLVEAYAKGGELEVNLVEAAGEAPPEAKSLAENHPAVKMRKGLRHGSA